nr:hypothetical protein [Tanacetum cinerariifolium]
MEIDPPHESDGSTTESKESETCVAADMESGIGLPYAPENFPQPGDTWSWKVGKRIASKGHFLDRYLYIPDRLYLELKSANLISLRNCRGFASKKAVERFLMEAFPGMDMKAFFSSFKWKIPSGKVKDRAENTDTLKEGKSEDIWKLEDASAVTTESIKLEQRIEKTLASLGNSQENECTVAEDALITQKNHLLNLYKELDKEKERLAKCSPSDSQSSVDAVIKRMDQIKIEHDKITAMQEAVGKGFGKTSKYVLNDHVGVQGRDS